MCMGLSPTNVQSMGEIEFRAELCPRFLRSLRTFSLKFRSCDSKTPGNGARYVHWLVVIWACKILFTGLKFISSVCMCYSRSLQHPREARFEVQITKASYSTCWKQHFHSLPSVSRGYSRGRYVRMGVLVLL